MNQWLMLYSSIRYTRPRQLWARLWFMVKRRLMVQLAQWGLAPRHRGPSLPLDTHPLEPLFLPRRGLVEQDGVKLFLRYLNRRDPLTSPQAWHPKQLEVGTRLEKLNLHYMEYLEAVDDGWFARVVEDWIASNPPYRPEYWLDNWNAYALSIRCVVWMQQLAVRRDKLTPGFCESAHRSLADQVRFLVRNLEVDILGNHLVKNIKALLWAGRYFTGREAMRWQALGQRLLRRELADQILPDGLHFERSPAYHTQVFADLLECSHALPADSALHRELRRVLDQMAQALVDLTHPDGLVSLFNDGGLHMAYAPQECLAVYERLTGALAQPRSVFALADAGYFGVRDQRGYCLVDCGPIGPDFLPAHGHGDVLAFEWDLGHKRMIVDAGVYEYHEGTWRCYSRSTTSHNTVTIGQQDQCEFWKSFRVGRRPTPHVHRLALDEKKLELLLEGSHNGYSHLPSRPVHRRRVDASPTRIVIEDQITTAPGSTHTARGHADRGLGPEALRVHARLMLHPGCVARCVEEGLLLDHGGQRALLKSTCSLTLEDAWWCPDFGVRHKTQQVVLDYGQAPCTGGFTLEALPA